jgi:hypothetical protein
MFTFTSRYYTLEKGQYTTADGRLIVYVRRRFVPPPDRFELLQEHLVTEGERFDTIAAEHLGDSEQFWRVCDANGVMQPEDLTNTVGRRIRITMPEGVPGPRNA